MQNLRRDSSHTAPDPPHGAPLRRSTLTLSFRRLVDLMQQVHFGEIRRLAVDDGEPDWSRGCEVVRTVKLSAATAPILTRLLDFELKREVVELLHAFRELQRGLVELIEVRHGLPVLLEIRDTIAA